MVDRFSLKTVWLDLIRSMRIYGSGKRDLAAQAVLLGVPAALAGVSVALDWQLSEPTALLPAASLLAGILLASAGQLISLRARIADSVLLAGNGRIRAIFREALSGSLIAAVAALLAAILLGAVAALPSDPIRLVQGVAQPAEASSETTLRILTAAVVLVLSFVALMFVTIARRLYQAFLEAFEGGRPLPPPLRKIESHADAEPHISGEPEDSALAELGIPDSSTNFSKK